MSAIQSNPTTAVALPPPRMPKVGDTVMYLFPLSMICAGSGFECPATITRVWTEDCIDVQLSHCIYREEIHQRYVMTKPDPRRQDGRSWRWPESPSPDVTIAAAIAADDDDAGSGSEVSPVKVNVMTSNCRRFGELVIPTNSRITRWTLEGM